MGVTAARPHPNVGVVAPRAPLLKVLEIPTDSILYDWILCVSVIVCN